MLYKSIAIFVFIWVAALIYSFYFGLYYLDEGLYDKSSYYFFRDLSRFDKIVYEGERLKFYRSNDIIENGNGENWSIVPFSFRPNYLYLRGFGFRYSVMVPSKLNERDFGMLIAKAREPGAGIFISSDAIEHVTYDGLRSAIVNFRLFDSSSETKLYEVRVR